VTKGIVSALDRTLKVSDTVTLHNLIQTDAPINHGNSGGALVDAQGRLIGINSAGVPDAQNIGFAIAIDTIKPLLADLTAGKTVHPSPTGFLGVTVVQTPTGVSVSTVAPDSAADKAGIEPGDILKAIGLTQISTIEQLSTTLRGLTPGTSTTVTVDRDGQPKTLNIELDARPADVGG
jgi:S1-C subfamily serine protease